MRTRTHRHGAIGGFSLIEVLVALAILSIAFVGFYQVFSSHLQIGVSARRQADAVLLARSVLERVGAEIPYKIGETSDRTADGLTWRVTVAEREDGADRRESPFLPVDVRVAVESEDGRLLFELLTVRLAPAGKL